MVWPIFVFNWTLIKSLTKNSLGWFRDNLLFTNVEQKNAIVNLLSLEDLVTLVRKIALIPVYITGNKVIVTNTITSKTVTYGSKSESARAMKADEIIFHNSRTRLFRGIYSIEVKIKND